MDLRFYPCTDVTPIYLFSQVRSSVAMKDLEFYREWNEEFGSFPFESHEG